MLSHSIKNFLTPEEVQWFIWYWDQRPVEVDDGGRFHSMAYYDQPFFANIRKKLDSKVPDDEYIKIVQISRDYLPGGVHSDGYIGEDSPEIGKLATSYLVPLVVSEPCYTLTFNNYSEKAVSLNEYAKLMYGIINYDEVGKEYFNLSAEPFDKDVHEKHLTHMDIKYLSGLKCDRANLWEVGSAITWPRAQLHCSANFSKEATRIMMLILTCKR
jgi:hypothetical protein|tara:strand:- start:668 stop:1309 length:642 start_codon:yes stop_codon:yes gene_type:complete